MATAQKVNPIVAKHARTLVRSFIRRRSESETPHSGHRSLAAEGAGHQGADPSIKKCARSGTNWVDHHFSNVDHNSIFEPKGRGILSAHERSRWARSLVKYRYTPAVIFLRGKASRSHQGSDSEHCPGAAVKIRTGDVDRLVRAGTSTVIEAFRIHAEDISGLPRHRDGS
jgi:hypothetical protein